jgi:hypothetical protein
MSSGANVAGSGFHVQHVPDFMILPLFFKKRADEMAPYFAVI